MVATAACFSHGPMSAPRGEKGQTARTTGSRGEVWSEEAEPEVKILRQGRQSGEGPPPGETGPLCSHPRTVRRSSSRQWQEIHTHLLAKAGGCDSSATRFSTGGRGTVLSLTLKTSLCLLGPRFLIRAVRAVGYKQDGRWDCLDRQEGPRGLQAAICRGRPRACLRSCAGETEAAAVSRGAGWP